MKYRRQHAPLSSLLLLRYREFSKKAAFDPETQNLNTVPQLLLLGGDVPVKSGDMVIGAIGIAGTGGPADDQHCTLEAIKEVMNK